LFVLLVAVDTASDLPGGINTKTSTCVAEPSLFRGVDRVEAVWNKRKKLVEGGRGSIYGAK
jgi:hypothetical protein